MFLSVPELDGQRIIKVDILFFRRRKLGLTIIPQFGHEWPVSLGNRLVCVTYWRSFHSIFIAEVSISCCTLEELFTDSIIDFFSMFVANMLPNKFFTTKAFLADSTTVLFIDFLTNTLLNAKLGFMFLEERVLMWV